MPPNLKNLKSEQGFSSYVRAIWDTFTQQAVAQGFKKGTNGIKFTTSWPILEDNLWTSGVVLKGCARK